MLLVKTSDIKVNPEAQVRMYTLNILHRVFQINPHLAPQIEQVLKPHLEVVKEAMNELPDRVEALTEELERT